MDCTCRPGSKYFVDETMVSCCVIQPGENLINTCGSCSVEKRGLMHVRKVSKLFVIFIFFFMSKDNLVGCDAVRQNGFSSLNNPCFQCNIAITNFLVSHTCEKRFHDVIGQSTVHMYSYAKILKHG